MLIQILFSIRSERQLMEQMQYNLLFRWFVGLGIDDPVWVPTVFSKNRDRLLTTDIARQLLAAILADKTVKPLLSDEHFSVDGTLIQAWASMKSFQPKEETGTAEAPAGGDAGPTREGDASAAANARPSQDSVSPTAERPSAVVMPRSIFHGQKRSNETHASRTDPEARLYRKGPGKEAKLCFMGHALMENRSGLIVDAYLTEASGHAERVAALAMIEPRADRPSRITPGADKGYDTEDFVNELRSMSVTRHVAAKVAGSAIDCRTPGIPAMPQASASASGSRRRSAGARPSDRSPEPCCAAWSASALSSPLHSPDRISRGCPNCWPYDEARSGLGTATAKQGRKAFPYRCFFSDLLELFGSFGIEANVRAEVLALPPGHPYLRLPLQFSTALAPRLRSFVDADKLERLQKGAEAELQAPGRWGTTFTLLQAWGQRVA